MFMEMTAAVKCIKEGKKKKNRNAGRAGGERAFYNSVALIAASETVQKKGWGVAKYMAFWNNNKSYAIYRPKMKEALCSDANFWQDLVCCQVPRHKIDTLFT